jgi:CRP-like cAMP-binding protein
MFAGDHKIKQLEQIPGLRRCPRPELRLIAAAADEARLSAGEVLRHGGDADRSFFLVLDGEAEVAEDGRRLRAGDSYGACNALVDGGPEAELRMRTDGRVLVLGTREFRGLMHRAPFFATTIAMAIAREAAS